MAGERTLVLGVDRDDDIGFKADVESPVIGRAACLDAATRLGLADPEDSDLNAIYQAVKIYDKLVAEGEDAVVAILAGNHMHMLEGDRKIAANLHDVVATTGATGCILISDGAEDEFVLPIIQSQVPVQSVVRVIVNQIPNLEGTYYILKKVLSDPKFSRFILVPPGLAMLLYAAANLFGYPQVATIVVVGAVGIYLLYKGLGVDEVTHDLMNSIRISLNRGRFSLVTYVVGVLLLILGVIMGLMSVLVHYSLDGTFGILLYLFTFLYGSVQWLTAGGIIISLGVIVDNFLYERDSLGKVVVFPFFIAAIGLVAYGASVYVMAMSNVADFPFSPDTSRSHIFIGTLAGIIASVAGVVAQYLVSRWVNRQGTRELIEIT